MAECNITAPSEYTGNTVCDGGTEQERLDNHCSWVSWVKDTFSTGLSTFASQLTTCVEWIATQRDNIQANRDYVANAKTTIETTMGAEYAGEWNDADDFKDKTVIYNGGLWVGLDSDVGNAPTWNSSKWLFLNEVTNYKNVTANVTADMGDVLLIDATNTTSTIDGVDVIEITLPNPAPNTHVRYIDVKGLFESDSRGVRLKTTNADDTVMGYDTNDDATAVVTDTKNASRTLIAVANGNNFDWRFI